MKAPTISDVLSDANMFEAWAKVKANKGCAGSDGQTISAFERNLSRNLSLLKDEVLSGKYIPLPLLRVEIPKKAGGMRALSIPAVRDRILQTAVALVIEPVFEAEFEDCSFAYRKGRSVDKAVARIASLRDQGYKWVVDVDIRDYFNSIDQGLLMEQVRRLIPDTGILGLIDLWLRCEVVDGENRYCLIRGVPQGAPISPLLANLYLDHLDEAFLRRHQKIVRFADDFVILSKDRDAAERALELTGEVLDSLRLSIHDKKTRVVDFASGFRFLGVQFIRSLAFKTKTGESRKTVAAAGDGMLRKDAGQGEAGVMKAAMEAAGLGPAVPEVHPVETRVVPEDSDVTVPSSHDPRLRTLYLLRHGYVLGKESRRFVIRSRGKTIREIPAIKVDQVMVFGNGQITTQAMHFCLQERIPIFLLSAHGHYYGVIDSFDTDPVLLHRDQFQRAEDKGFCLRVARQFVRGKIANSRTVLMRNARKRDAPEFRQAAGRLKAYLDKAGGAETMDELRGIEGSAASRYFSAIAGTIQPEWNFTGRQRQPPPDPVNAMLSYGYTLLFYNIYSLVRARGLNPHVGYLHAMRAGHPALVSDLMEEFRAIVVDAVVLNLVLNKRVAPGDFVPENGGSCLMGQDARTRLIRALESKLNSSLKHPVSGLKIDYRRGIEHQANHLAAVIRGTEPDYRPMVLR